MIKAKRTEQLSWWDKYVLGKQTFHYESPLSLEECAANIALIKDARPRHAIQITVKETFAASSRFEIYSVNQSVNETFVSIRLHQTASTHFIGNLQRVESGTIMSGISILGRKLDSAKPIYRWVMIFWIISTLLCYIATYTDRISSTGFPAIILAFCVFCIVLLPAWIRIRQTNFNNRVVILQKLEQAIGVQRKRKSHD